MSESTATESDGKLAVAYMQALLEHAKLHRRDTKVTISTAGGETLRGEIQHWLDDSVALLDEKTTEIHVVPVAAIARISMLHPGFATP